jgi:hypothetical protein
MVNIMPRELALHPETGQLVEVVHSYQGLEMKQLEDDVNAKQDVLDGIGQREVQALEALEVVRAEKAKAEADLEDSKSLVGRGQELVEQAARRDLDARQDGAGGEAENAVAGADGNF